MLNTLINPLKLSVIINTPFLCKASVFRYSLHNSIKEVTLFIFSLFCTFHKQSEILRVLPSDIRVVHFNFIKTLQLENKSVAKQDLNFAL